MILPVFGRKLRKSLADPPLLRAGISWGESPKIYEISYIDNGKTAGRPFVGLNRLFIAYLLGGNTVYFSLEA